MESFSDYRSIIEEAKQLEEEVRKKLDIYITFGILIDKNIPTAQLDLKNFRIVLNPDFFERFDRKGKKGLIAHEIGHYREVPFDLKTYIEELFVASRHLPEAPQEILYGVVDLFNDLVVNVRVSKTIGEIADTYRQLEANNPIDRVFRVYYSEKTKKDFGKYKLTREEKKLLKELKKIDPYAEREKLVREELPKFIKLLFQFYQESENSYKNFSYQKIEEIKLSKKELEEAIRSLIREGKINKKDIKNIPRLFSRSKKVKRSKDDSEDISDLVDELFLFANREYYKTQAEKYEIKVEPLSLINYEEDVNRKHYFGLYPISKSDWSVSDPTSSIDFLASASTSGLRIIPGLTKKREYENPEVPIKEEKRIILSTNPPLILILDSSYSMPNPIEETSPAVIAAYVVARKYLSKGVDVAVINFSSRTIVVDFTRDFSKVEEGILLYQGGNTYLDVNAIKELDRKKHGPYLPDVVMITDVGLNERENLIETLEYLNSTGERRRVYIFWIEGDNPPDMEELKRTYKRIQFFNVDDPSKLPKIVIKKCCGQ
ncbi:MAG: hypothetical protein QW197_03770 [Candidatus Aenigmatarchaeota archaeon]